MWVVYRQYCTWLFNAAQWWSWTSRWRCRNVELSNSGMVELVEMSNRQAVEWWSCRIVGSSNGGMVDRVGRLVESYNGDIVELLNNRIVK